MSVKCVCFYSCLCDACVAILVKKSMFLIRKFIRNGTAYNRLFYMEEIASFSDKSLRLFCDSMIRDCDNKD